MFEQNLNCETINIYVSNNPNCGSLKNYSFIVMLRKCYIKCHMMKGLGVDY